MPHRPRSIASRRPVVLRNWSWRARDRAAFAVATPDGRGLISRGHPVGAELSLWWRPAAGGPAQRLTTGLGENGQPSVSADGRTLVATVVEPRQSIVVAARLMAATRRRSSARLATPPRAIPIDHPPYGRRVVFKSGAKRNRNLWIAAADGSRATQPLTSGSAIDDRPAFSPDGKSIAFVSDRGGARGVWTVSADGGSVRLVGKAQVLDTHLVVARRFGDCVGPVGDQPGLSAIRVADGTTRRLEVAGGVDSCRGPGLVAERRGCIHRDVSGLEWRTHDDARGVHCFARTGTTSGRQSARPLATARSRGTEAAGASRSTEIRAPSPA